MHGGAIGLWDGGYAATATVGAILHGSDVASGVNGWHMEAVILWVIVSTMGAALLTYVVRR